MTKNTLKKLSEKLMDLGNISLGTLSIGILISGKEFTLWLFLSGFIFWAICNFIGIILSERGEKI